jgi:hypothetical protein
MQGLFICDFDITGQKRAQGANKFPKSINEFFRPFEDIVEALGTALETLEAGVEILAED